MTSTRGSFSARVDEKSVVITPYRIDRSALTMSELVVIKDGKCAPGLMPSRAVALHNAIYKAHPEIQAVVNALPVSATAFSVSDAELNTRTIPESFLFLKDVRKIPFERQYADSTAVASAIGPKSPVVLLEHNGALVAGRTVLDAFDRLEVLEATAAAILRARPLGAITPMSDQVVDELLAAFPAL